MRFPTRTARLTSLFALGAAVFAALMVANPRGWLVSAFAAAAPQQTTPLSFDAEMPVAALGKPYLQSMRPHGGKGGYTFVEGSTLPPGMKWVPTGDCLLLRGTPTQAGDYAIQIIVNDSLGQQITKDATFHVTPYDTAATVPVTATESIIVTDSYSSPIVIAPSTIPTPITLTPAMRDSLGPQPERLFRLAGRCTANKCVNWDNRECGLIGRMRETVDAQVVATLPDGTLPDCGIRDACVWWRQSGAEACRVCRFVIYNPTP